MPPADPPGGAGQADREQASGGARAVLAALGANLGIAATKFLAFAITGSASLLAGAGPPAAGLRHPAAAAGGREPVPAGRDLAASVRLRHGTVLLRVHRRRRALHRGRAVLRL